MADDILTVSTVYSDVVALAQGYINRADGERILLPLEVERAEGAGIRFVVLLADGTPAFAGAGLCVQVSDQGGTVPAEHRYETLLDSLQFDERSRPVYDYIVAVRNAAYAQGGTSPGATEAAAQPEVEADLEALDAGHDEEATAIVSPGAMAAARANVVSAAPPSGLEWGASASAEAATSWAPSQPPGAPSYRPGMPSFPAPDEPAMPSFVPPPIPTGILTRPARAAHWQPLPPRRPSARPSSGLFRYAAGPLPRPSSPPHPEMDPAQRVAPAPRPAS